MLRRCLFLLALALATPALAQWVRFTPTAGEFPLAGAGQVATVVTDPADHDVVAIAAGDLRNDIATVTPGTPRPDVQVWVGTLGRNAAIDRLVSSGRLDARALRGAWESYLIATVERPAPGVSRALVVVGSDRRGTAYGAYELSRAIGVSPWHCWADVTPTPRAALSVARGTRRFGPPSVRYRGIFLNDEDWGLVPWAAGTHAPQERPLGPATHQRLFELMLRLRANLLWPAMHKITQPFFANPENAAMADRYAIVIGTSHAEPMLRNNVGEWKDAEDRFNYVTHPDGVRAYWQGRVTEQAGREAIWTLGMRGIHDSGMVGPATPEARRQTLERIFTDQRAMLAAAGVPDAPQVFTPYKEVLDIYRTGLAVPDDVTLMWPDDNFGYIRHFPDAAERARSGGSGIYYHLSYLGAPLSYLWLSTTPPALIREEMGRAHDLGARRMWVVNVGDLKPAELATSYFLDLAWNIETRAIPIDDWVGRWAAETVDAEAAPQIAAVLATHHRLNFERRPEHLQWYLPGERPNRRSPLSVAQADERLAAFAASESALAAIAPTIPARRQDSFFQLVAYPVQVAAAANRRFFAAEAHDRLRDSDLAEAQRRATSAAHADAEVKALTARYNREIGGGKWRGFMSQEPADGQWRSYRLDAPILPVPDHPPAQPLARPAAPATATPLLLTAAFKPGNGWRVVDGLGRHGQSLAADAKPTPLAATITLPSGRWRMLVDILPTYADRDGDPLRLIVSVNGVRHDLAAPRNTGDGDWARAVLDNRISLAVKDPLAAGPHRIGIVHADRGAIIESIRFEPCECSI